MTPWREWLAPQRAKMRASSAGTAGFLLAVFFIVEFQALVARELVQLLRQHSFAVDLESLDSFTWPWLREQVLELFLRMEFLTSATFHGTVVPIAICFLATAWFFELKWKETFSKLGLPKPKSSEFMIPMIACVPALAVALLILWPLSAYTIASQGTLPAPTISAIPLAPFWIIIPMGLLYRGLIQDAKWSGALSTITVLLAMTVVTTSTLLSTTGVAWSLPVLVISTAYTLVHVGVEIWLFRRWNYRAWSLVFLAFGGALVSHCIPTGFETALGRVSYLLELTPSWLLLLWTLVSLPSESGWLMKLKTLGARPFRKRTPST